MPAEKAGPMMERHIIDGKTVYLPVGSVLEPPAPKDMTDDDAAAWLEVELKKPLGKCF
ncbi:hypothetical protein [Roseibium sp.]|uniref:hypothetical protein n=1 Tax=Roseibium sp. TaxID=1936156 RepID=UPI003BB0E78F